MAISTILVDDADTSRISYDASWGTAGSTFEHDSTTHHTDNARAVLSFPFNGTSLAVHGTVASNQASNPITCNVDGADIPAPLIAPAPQNQYHKVFCSVDALSGDTPHNLIMTVDGSTSRFFLDYFMYTYDDTSSQSAVPDAATSPARRVIDDADAAVAYAGVLPGINPWVQEGGPDELAGTTHRTNSPGATATFRFTGTSIGVYGTMGQNSILSPPYAASFTVDDGEPEQYRPPAMDGIARQVLLFERGDLLEGEHTIVVTNILPGTAPLWIDYFQVSAPASFGPGLPPVESSSSESSSSSSSSSFSSSIPPTSTPSSEEPSTITNTRTETQPPVSTESGASNASESSKSNTGMIAGIAIGAVAVLVILVVLGAWIYRRRKRRSHEVIDFGPSDHTVSPYPVADGYSDKHDASPYGAGAAVGAGSGYVAHSSQPNILAAPLPYRSTHTSSPAPQSTTPPAPPATTMYSDHRPSYGYGNQAYPQYAYGSDQPARHDSADYGKPYQNYEQQGYYSQQVQQAQHHVGNLSNPYGEIGYHPSPYPAPAPAGGRGPRIFSQTQAQDSAPAVPSKSNEGAYGSRGADAASGQGRHRRDSSGSIAQLPWTR